MACSVKWTMCILLQDFSEAADALGSLNLSEGWSNLSLRSRQSESGAQDIKLRDQREHFMKPRSSIGWGSHDEADDDNDHEDHLVSDTLDVHSGNRSCLCAFLACLYTRLRSASLVKFLRRLCAIDRCDL